MQLKKIRGFSLIEMLVANSLFAIVIVISISTIISLSSVSSIQKTARLVFEDMNILLDSMTKEIRQGNTYGCLKDETSLSSAKISVDCDIDYLTNNAGIGIEFVSQDDTIYAVPGGSSVRTRYFFQNNKIYKNKITVNISGTILSSTTPDVISGQSVNVKEFYLYVVGSADSNAGDFRQPVVFMRIIGNKILNNFNSKDYIKDFDIYTSISQRESDS